MQRRSATGATILQHIFDAKPSTARRALRIQTLNGPAWKLQDFLSTR
jgi:hypothetical protein